MTNLYKETVEKLAEYDRTIDDIIFVYGEDFRITVDNFIDVAKNTEYNDGFGWAEVAQDLTILGNDFIMYREEYDGSEWWTFKWIDAKIPTEIRSVNKLADSYSGWSTTTLKNINEKG